MTMYTFEKRIMEVEHSINRLNEIIAHLEKDIEDARKVVITRNEKYQKIETDTLFTKEQDKYKLSLMYQRLLEWHNKIVSAGEDFDGLNKTCLEKKIRKLQYEHELKKLKELVEGSGAE